MARDSLGMLTPERYLRIKKIQKDIKSHIINVTLVTDRNEYSPGEPILLSLHLSTNSQLKIYKLGTIFDGFHGLAYERDDADPLLDNFVQYPDEAHTFADDEEEDEKNYFSINSTSDCHFEKNIQNDFFRVLGEYKVSCIKPYCYHSGTGSNLAGKGTKVKIHIEPITIKIIPQEERDAKQKIENEVMERERIKKEAIELEIAERKRRDEEAHARFEEEERIRREKKKAQEAEWKRQAEEKERLRLEAIRQAEEDKLRAIEEERLRIEMEKQRIEDEKKRIEKERLQKIQEELRLIEEEKQRILDEEKRQIEMKEKKDREELERVGAEKQRMIQLEMKIAEDNEKMRLEQELKIQQEVEAKLAEEKRLIEVEEHRKLEEAGQKTPEPIEEVPEKKTRGSHRKGTQVVEPVVEKEIIAIPEEIQPIQKDAEPIVEKSVPEITVERVDSPKEKPEDKEEKRKARLEKRRGKRDSVSTPQKNIIEGVITTPCIEKVEIEEKEGRKSTEIVDVRDVFATVEAPVEIVEKTGRKSRRRFTDDILVNVFDQISEDVLEVEIKVNENTLKMPEPLTERMSMIMNETVESHQEIQQKQETIEVKPTTEVAGLEGVTDEEKKLITKRDAIIKEFLSTERTYVGDLHNMGEFYVPFLPSYITDSEFKTIFLGFDEIVRVNTSFLVQLEDIAQTPLDEKFTRERKVAELMLNYSKEFAKYQPFVLNYGAATTMIRELKKTNEKFKNFLLAQRQEVMTKTNNRHNDLNSILITPVQRLPRYRLLLADLQRNIDPSTSPDLFKICTDAMDATHAVTVRINEVKKGIENRQRLLEIINSNELGIKGLQDKEYVRDLKGAHFKTSTGLAECDIYLFADCLAIKYAFLLTKKLMIMPLVSCSVTVIKEKFKEKFGLLILIKDKKEALYFKTDGLRLDWSKEITLAINNIKSK